MGTLARHEIDGVATVKTSITDSRSCPIIRVVSGVPCRCKPDWYIGGGSRVTFKPVPLSLENMEPRT